jgi:hypothetical protein
MLRYLGNYSLGLSSILAALVAVVRAFRVKTITFRRSACVWSYRSPNARNHIVMLGQLAPDIQEYVLFLRAEHTGLISEQQLRAIAREPRWDRQRERFQKLLGRRS